MSNNEYQIKGLEKLANSGIIKDIYPMVDRIAIRDDGHETAMGNKTLSIDIFLNDENITSDNMYDMELDPHYLVEFYLKQYFPYFNIDKVAIDFIVWGPNGDIIHSWDN
jgi:hypothetical protein